MSNFASNKWGEDTPPGSPERSGMSGSPGAWARKSGGGDREQASEAPAPDPTRTRPKLKLAPRSKTAGTTASTGGASSSIFGAARSREDVLKEKGIDAKTLDEKVNKKAQVLKLTKDQEEEAEACRSELAFAEKELREANENELPEGNKRENWEKKKVELQDLLDGFSKLNVEKAAEKDKELTESLLAGKQQRFERPSERRARQEAEERDGGGRDGGRGGDRDRDRDRDGGDRRGSGNRDNETFGGDGGGRRDGGNRRDRSDSDSFKRRDEGDAFANFGNRRGEEGGEGADRGAVGGGGRFFD